MGECIYCGRPAGLFRKQHKECATAADEARRQAEERTRQAVARREAGRNKIIAHITSGLPLSADIQALVATTEPISAEHDLSEEDVSMAYTSACAKIIDQAMEDGLLSEEEEQRILRLMQASKVQKENLPDKAAWDRLVKMAVLRDVMNERIPDRLVLTGAPHINLQKSESIVWAFKDCRYLEDKDRIQYKGGSQGLSFRVAKGVYYRVGGFKGERVSTTERVHVDTGWMFITTKHIYFAGTKKSLRIPYRKIVSFLPFGDGIGLIRDTQTAKPQLFVTGDGWFSFNLAANLAARDS